MNGSNVDWGYFQLFIEGYLYQCAPVIEKLTKVGAITSLTHPAASAPANHSQAERFH
jgi:hypothetical protein